jgi:hypothetical protein
MKLEVYQCKTPLSASTVLAIVVGLFTFTPIAGADEANRQVLVRDITSIEGVRENMLVGYGLVVGLRGTGDTPADDLHRPDAGQRHAEDGRADLSQHRRGQERSSCLHHRVAAAVCAARRQARRHRLLRSAMRRASKAACF